MQMDAFQKVFINSAIYVFGRSWVDRILSTKMPTDDTKDPAVTANEWGFWRWFVTFTAFDMGVAFLKNLNVIGFEGLTTYLYAGLGLLGVGITLYKERVQITDWMKSLFMSKAVKLTQMQSCQTFIAKVRPTPEPVK
jgi:hypothetical protein